VQAIIGLGRQQRVLVLSSDRGRGKSAAMGMAAAHLMQIRKQRIVLTGPRLDAVGAVLRHAAARLPEAETGARQLSLGEGSLRFLPPDRLVVMAPKADLLLVDEAATIPAPLLTRLLTRFRRVVFATTVHGYEGSGRGFQLRFRRVLDEKAPGWRLLRLREPIRYAADDPLESLGFRARSPGESWLPRPADGCRTRAR
jgi:tRNA(Met) cytidine acetyltransferase